MINQQLTDFIKQQLQQGLDKEKISGELLANGWTKEDIEEGFKAIDAKVITLNSNPISTPSSADSSLPSVKVKNHSGRKIFFIVLVLLLLAGGASAYYFRDNLINLPIVKNIFPSVNTVALQNDVTTPTIPDTTQQQNSATQTSDTQAVTQTEQPNAGYKVIDPYNNFDQCSLLTGDKLHLCYFEVVVSTKDDSVCEKFTTQSDKNSCYSTAALVKNDSSICNKAGNMAGNCKFMALVEIPNTNPTNCNGTDSQSKAECISSANALKTVMALVQERTNQGKSPNLNLTMTPDSPVAGQNITITAEVTDLVAGETVSNINFLVLGGNPSVIDKAPYETVLKIPVDAKGEQIYPVQVLTNTGIYIMKNIVFDLK